MKINEFTLREFKFTEQNIANIPEWEIDAPDNIMRDVESNTPRGKYIRLGLSEFIVGAHMQNLGGGAERDQIFMVREDKTNMGLMDVTIDCDNHTIRVHSLMGGTKPITVI